MSKRQVASWNAREHRPALDGLRAVAVVLVCFFHLNGVWAPGGSVGVDLFFALSGFLITGLLLSEIERNGSVNLPKFFGRRAVRLFPALLVLLIFVVFACSPGSTVVLGALFYFGNWIACGNEERMGVLLHTWSLSVEEQFYLGWPLILLVGLKLTGRARLRFWCSAAAVIGIVAAVATRFVVSEGLFVNYSTVTRVDGILLGCIAALWMPELIRFLPRVAFTVGGLAGWFIVFCLVWVSPHEAINPYLTPIAAVLIVAALATNAPALIARGLSLPPVTWLGRISYSLYLWHLPLNRVMPLGMSSGVRALMVFAVSLVAAAASYHLLERPLMRRFSPMLRS